MFIAGSAFANPFSKFIGSYVPVGKSTEQFYGKDYCELFGFRDMTEFKVNEVFKYPGNEN